MTTAAKTEAGTTTSPASGDAPLVIRAQHTPGPWKQVGREIWVEGGILTRSEVEQQTGSTYAASPDEVLANAALIAAAPEMYEALKMFIAWEDRTHDTSPAGQFNAAIEAARAILSKIDA